MFSEALFPLVFPVQCQIVFVCRGWMVFEMICINNLMCGQMDEQLCFPQHNLAHLRVFSHVLLRSPETPDPHFSENTNIIDPQ